MTYTIPMIPPSLNQFAGRKNVWQYRELKAEWLNIVAVYCRPRPAEPLTGVTVEITYYFPTRTRHDPDNFNGKMILDGLVKCGILKDDSFNCINLVLKGGYDKDNPRTIINIT